MSCRNEPQGLCALVDRKTCKPVYFHGKFTYLCSLIYSEASYIAPFTKLYFHSLSPAQQSHALIISTLTTYFNFIHHREKKLVRCLQRTASMFLDILFEQRGLRGVKEEQTCLTATNCYCGQCNIKEGRFLQLCALVKCFFFPPPNGTFKSC